jgi:hypothetical protein
MITIHHSTPSINTFTEQTTMIDNDVQFVTRKMLFNKPLYNTFAAAFGVVVTRNIKKEHNSAPIQLL